MHGVITRGAAPWLLVMASPLTAGVVAQTTADPAARAVTPVYQEMIDVTKPASDAIFDIDREAPMSDEAWNAMARAGAMLAESGDRVSRFDPQASDRRTWVQLSRQMADAGRRATRAAEARNLGSLTRASDRLVIVCETCHARYRKPVVDQE